MADMFETEHLIVRSFRDADAQKLYENHLDEEVKKWFPNESYADPAEAQDAVHFYSSCVRNEQMPYVVGAEMKETGELIGDAGISEAEGKTGEIEIGYCIGQKYRSKGYATELVKAVTEFVMAKFGINVICGRVVHGNEASEKVLKKAGYRFVEEEFGAEDDPYGRGMLVYRKEMHEGKEEVKMDFYDAVRARRSVRDFTEEKIPENKLRKILEAAYQAPANDHFRDWHYIVITDPEMKQAALGGVPQNLTEKDVDQMTFISDPVQKKSYQVAVPKQYKMLFEAAAVIVPLMKKKTDILHPADLSDLNVYASVWCSIENLWLAATAEGYGCNLRIPRGDEEAIAQKALGVPEGYLIPCFLGIGRPAPDAVLTKQIDLRLEELIHWQGF